MAPSIYSLICERWDELLLGPGLGTKAAPESVELLDDRIAQILDLLGEAQELVFDGPRIWTHSKLVRYVATGIRTVGSRYFGCQKATLFVINHLSVIRNSGYREGMLAAGNWWEWTVGIPQALVDVMVLLRGRLPEHLVEELMAAVRHNIPDVSINRWSRSTANKHMTSANLVDQAQPLLLLACLQADSKLLKSLVSLIENEVKFVSEGDGLYVDGSYIFHENIPYNGTYGAVFFRVLLKIKYVLNGSSLDLSNTVGQYLIFFAERALIPFLINFEYTPVVCGRAANRPSRSSDSFQFILDLLIFNHIADPPSDRLRWFAIGAIRYLRKSAYSDYRPEQASSSTTITSWVSLLHEGSQPESELGHQSMERGRSQMYWYPRMLRGVFRSKYGWIAEVALSDQQVSYFEFGASENEYGYHSGNGAFWINPGGREPERSFQDVEPLLVPGATINTSINYTPGKPWAKAAPANRWAGGIGDGQEFAVLSMDMHGYQSNLRAFKSWFFFPGCVVYMASRICGHDGNGRTIFYASTVDDESSVDRVNDSTVDVLGWGRIQSVGKALTILEDTVFVSGQIKKRFAVCIEHVNESDDFSVFIFPQSTAMLASSPCRDFPDVVNMVNQENIFHGAVDYCGQTVLVASGEGECEVGSFTIGVSRSCVIAITSSGDIGQIYVSDPADEKISCRIKVMHRRSLTDSCFEIVIPDLGRQVECFDFPLL